MITRDEYSCCRYIIWNASLTAAFEMLYGIAHPEPLYPYIMLMSGGLAKNVGLPAVAAVLYVDIVFFLVISVVVSTMFLFTFRYSQTVQSRLADWLSNWKMVVPIVAAILVVCTATIVAPFHVLSYTGERIQKHFDPGVQDAVHGRLAVGYEVMNGTNDTRVDPRERITICSLWSPPKMPMLYVLRTVLR